MILADARLWRFITPLVSPVEVRPGIILRDRETLLLEFVAADGRTSWGEAAPLPGFSRESLEDVVSQAQALARRITACGTSGADLTDSLLPSIGAFPSLEFAVETAVASLEVQPLHAHTRLPTSRLLQGDRNDILRRAGEFAGAGYGCLKLKVGRGSVDDEVELLTQLRQEVGSGVGLRADANRAWTLHEALRFAEGVVGLNLEFVEEPLQDSSRLEELHRESGLPLALDETLGEWGLTDVVIPEYVSAIVLKPTLLGGRRAAELTASARRGGIKAVMSSCYESGVGTAAIVRLAFGYGPRPAAVGLGTIEWIGQDCLEPAVDFDRPELTASEISAAKIRPLKDRLQPIPFE